MFGQVEMFRDTKFVIFKSDAVVRSIRCWKSPSPLPRSSKRPCQHFRLDFLVVNVCYCFVNPHPVAAGAFLVWTLFALFVSALALTVASPAAARCSRRVRVQASRATGAVIRSTSWSCLPVRRVPDISVSRSIAISLTCSPTITSSCHLSRERHDSLGAM